MFRNRFVFFSSALVAASFILLFSVGCRQREEPAVRYFPEDEQSTYLTASTRLELTDDGRELVWTVHSQFDRRPFLLQSFSLLYKNDRLFAMLNYWDQNINRFSQIKSFRAETGFYQALSIHHAELHKNESIFGKDKISKDTLLVDTGGKKPTKVPDPDNAQEKKVMNHYLDHITRERTRILRTAKTKYHLDLSHYRIMPLTELSDSYNDLHPFFNEKTARKIVSQLWEGLYSIYLSGIQVTPDRNEPAAGSSMPILLISGDHMLIIVETRSGHLALLRQNFS